MLLDTPPGQDRHSVAEKRHLGAVMKLIRLGYLAIAGFALIGVAWAQGTAEDYKRAEEMRTRFFGLVPNLVDEPNFSEDNATLVYRRSLSGGGSEFVKVD